MNLVTLGPEGTFSHEVAELVCKNSVTLVPTIREVFREVVENHRQGLVPLENSEAGGVGPTLDGLMAYKVFITAEIFMPVHHFLVAPPGVCEIGTLFVHPQTHEQCSEVIEQLGAEVIHTSSNAASAKAALRSPGSGAIVSRKAAELYGLPIVRSNVENNPDNVTRFVCIDAAPGETGKPGKCSILVDPESDRAGLLHELLGVFSRKEINLTRIESRPSKRGMGRYVFFIDLSYSPACPAAIKELTTLTNVRNLGCYARMEVPGWTC
jgi:prephenate dehydratase